jgi:uncharacterized cupredoxin-like copper-binding protein
VFAARHKTMSVFVAAAGVALLLGGCSSDKTSSSGSGSSPGKASPSPTTAAGPATTVNVTESEFKITLSQPTFKPGTYTFKVVNQGKFPHNLTIEGPGVDKTASPTLQGGQAGELTVTLKAGSYEFWCSVDSHKDKGMDMTVTVA